MALVAALLLLLVVTMLAVGMFRSFGLQERIAGNTRDKQRANSGANGSLTNTETYLVANATTIADGASSGGAACAAGLTTTQQVCSNIIATPTQMPWATGVKFVSPQMTIASAGTLNGYIQEPLSYISFLGQNYIGATGTQIVAYQVDAMSYGATTSTVSVVESNYLVSVSYNARSDKQKFINLGGP
jgi:type IV pilus assembly protein PilX